MVIYSEKTKKTYPSVDACAADEAAYDAKIAEEKRIAEEKEQARKVREAELDAAHKAIEEAVNKYNDLIDAYNKDYPDGDYCPCDCECDEEDEDECECDCGCECCNNGNHETIPKEVLAAIILALMR